VEATHHLLDAVDRILDYDPEIRIAIEPKPNEPMDLAYVPTIGHALALAFRSHDPARVGSVVESAHAVLAGLDPADEMGFALAFRQPDPARVGCVVESAHAILAGLDPADEMGFALAFDKLYSIHLNDQNGLKFDQDRSFGSVNLRRALDQVLVLEDNAYASKG